MAPMVDLGHATLPVRRPNLTVPHKFSGRQRVIEEPASSGIDIQVATPYNYMYLPML